MYRTFKRKLILNKMQEQRILSWVGTCRTVYNLGLEIRKEAYKNCGTTPSSYDLMRDLAPLRKEIDWMRDVPVQCQEHAIERLDGAYCNFFRGKGFPKWASKRRYKSISFRYSIRASERWVRIPKIGKLKMFRDAPIEGVLKAVHITIEPTGFFVCLKCELPDLSSFSVNEVGIDMGIAQFATLSTGEAIENPRHFAGYERKLRIEGRSLARKKKGSNSWKRQAKKLALLHHKIGNVRKDFLHKHSAAIAKQYSTVYLEDLNVQGMVKNKNLSKHIIDCGWGMFRIMLAYKTNVVTVDPKHTSQICNACGAKDSKSRVTQSEYACTSCGHVDNADVNAAKNIKGRGTALERKRKALA